MKITWVDPINTDAQFLNIMSDSFLRCGHEIDVFSLSTRFGGIPEGVNWHEFDKFLGGRLRQRSKKMMTAYAAIYPLDWMLLISKLRSRGEKAVILSSSLKLPEYDTAGHWMLRKAGIQTAVVVHKPHPEFYENHGKIRALRYRQYFSLASKILVMTEYTRDLMHTYYDLPLERFALFPHPHLRDYLSAFETDAVLLDSLKKWADGQPVISLFSSYSHEHGHDTFLKALPILKRELPKVKILYVVGNVKPGDIFAKNVESSLLDAGFNKEDYRLNYRQYTYPELLAFINVTSLVALPYNWATQSGVIPLATGFGIPVVTTNVGGLSEMIEQGVSGMVVPAGEPAAFAVACKTILLDSGYNKYRKNSFDVSNDKLSPGKAVENIVSILRQLSNSG